MWGGVRLRGVREDVNGEVVLLKFKKKMGGRGGHIGGGGAGGGVGLGGQGGCERRIEVFVKIKKKIGGGGVGGGGRYI